MIEIELDENGEPIVEVWIRDVSLPPFLADMDRTKEEWDKRCNDTVRAYRLSKNSAKLSDFERAALEGTIWVRRRRGPGGHERSEVMPTERETRTPAFR